MIARAGGGSPDRVGGGGLPTGGQGSKVYVLYAKPKEHKRFRPGARPGGIGFPAGGIGDRGDREIGYVPNVYVPFPAPRIHESAWSMSASGRSKTCGKRVRPEREPSWVDHACGNWLSQNTRHVVAGKCFW